MQFESTLKKTLIHIDPRTKFVMLFFIGFYIFTLPTLPVEIGIFVALGLLLTLSGHGRTALKLSVVFTAMVLLDILLSPYMSGALSFLFNTIVRLVRLIFPIYLAAILLMRTTTVSEFIAAFRKIHLPDTFIIPVSVMFRFIPTVTKQWHSIRNAMRFRGIGVSAKTLVRKPLLTLEYMLVPLLMSTAIISDELAAASLSRGLDSGATRTCVTEVRIGAFDYILLAACVVLAALSLLGVV